MAGVNSFTDLRCWQGARELSKSIFRRAKQQPFVTDRKLVEQINDSSESVMSNIAEGFGRGTQAEFLHFLSIALGSLEETRSHLCAAYDREYLLKAEFEEFWRQSTDNRGLTVAFVRSMVRPGGGVKYTTNHKSWTDEVWETYERLTGKPRPELFRTPKSESSKSNARNDAPPV